MSSCQHVSPRAAVSGAVGAGRALHIAPRVSWRDLVLFSTLFWGRLIKAVYKVCIFLNPGVNSIPRKNSALCVLCVADFFEIFESDIIGYFNIVQRKWYARTKIGQYPLFSRRLLSHNLSTLGPVANASAIGERVRPPSKAMRTFDIPTPPLPLTPHTGPRRAASHNRRPQPAAPTSGAAPPPPLPPPPQAGASSGSVVMMSGRRESRSCR